MLKGSWKIWLRNLVLAAAALVVIFTAGGFYLMSNGSPQEGATNEVLNCGNTVAQADCTQQKRKQMDAVLGEGVNPEDLTNKYKSIATDGKNVRLEDREKNRKELTKGW